MQSKEWLQGCKMMAGAGVMFQPDAVKALLDHIANLEENATAQALALKAAKAMQQAETERADADAARLDFVEKMARQSQTGVSFDWCRHVYDGMVLERGYRVMWHRKLNDRADNIRDAIDQAMRNL